MKDFNSIDEILEFAINSEQEAVDFYTKLAENSNSEAMKKVFVQFAGEEMGHKAKLLDIKAKGFFTAATEEIMDLKISDYLVNAKIHPEMTYQEALIIAMKKEKSAFKLYLSLSERVNDQNMKALFLNLAMEESKHKLRFEIEYDEYVLKEN